MMQTSTSIVANGTVKRPLNGKSHELVTFVPDLEIMEGQLPPLKRIEATVIAYRMFAIHYILDNNLFLQAKDENGVEIYPTQESYYPRIEEMTGVKRAAILMDYGATRIAIKHGIVTPDHMAEVGPGFFTTLYKEAKFDSEGNVFGEKRCENTDPEVYAEKIVNAIKDGGDLEPNKLAREVIKPSEPQPFFVRRVENGRYMVVAMHPVYHEVDGDFVVESYQPDVLINVPEERGPLMDLVVRGNVKDNE